MNAAWREALTAPLPERVTPGNYVMAAQTASAIALARFVDAAMAWRLSGWR
jgi:hypothetical protein